MKAWYESRMVWVGLLTVVFGILKLLGMQYELTPGVEEMVLGVIVVILRLITGSEVVLKK